MKRAYSALFGALALSAAITGPALAQEAAAPEPQIVNVTILGVGDLDSFDAGIEDGSRGGFARLNALVRAEKAANPNMLYLYSGDLISPSLLSGIDQGANTIELINMVTPDVAVPGNHEFDFGPEVFAARLEESNFPWSAVNITGPNGEPVEGLGTEPVIKEIEGVKIGIVPVATDETPELASPGDLKFAPTVESALAGADAAREAGADIVIALVHASHPQDDAMIASGKFDLILSGHDHDYQLRYNEITGYVETSNDANYLTAIDLEIAVTPEAGEDPREVEWTPNFRFIDTRTVDPDAETMAAIEKLQGELSTELDVEIGTTETPLDSRRTVIRGQEAAIGNLIADAQRAANGADIAITNGGGIRADKEYPAGTVLTRRDIFSELPFGNITVVTELSGQAVLEALENGFSQMESGAGRFPHVSGITVEVDPSQPPGSRVVSVKVGDEPLDPSRTYTVATNDFMLGGGDGFTSLGKGKVLINAAAGNLMASDVINYIEGTGTVAPEVEGRIVVKQ